MHLSLAQPHHASPSSLTRLLYTLLILSQIVHQTYALPWPLKPRELLMQCINEVLKGSHVLIMTCRSVQSDLLPVTKSAIRMDILQSRWTFEALPCGKTRIRTEMLIEEKFAIGVPSVLITFVQNTALKESVVQFAKAVRRMQLGRHPDFVYWGSTTPEPVASLGAGPRKWVAGWRRLRAAVANGRGGRGDGAGEGERSRSDRHRDSGSESESESESESSRDGGASSAVGGYEATDEAAFDGLAFYAALVVVVLLCSAMRALYVTVRGRYAKWRQRSSAQRAARQVGRHARHWSSEGAGRLVRSYSTGSLEASTGAADAERRAAAASTAIAAGGDAMAKLLMAPSVDISALTAPPLDTDRSCRKWHRRVFSENGLDALNQSVHAFADGGARRRLSICPGCRSVQCQQCIR
jgi:hypothetical protein